MQGGHLSSKAFVGVLAKAALFLSLSAIILTSGFLILHSKQVREMAGIKPIAIDGSSFRFEMGSGEQAGKALLVDSLRNGHVVLNGPRRFLDADQYPFLEYQIEGIHAGVILAFYWRTVETPQKVHFVELPWTGLMPTVLRMEAQEAWHGRILDYGLSISGDLRGSTMEIRKLSFKPYRYQTLLRAVWSEWLAFEGWRQYSINTRMGGVPDPMAPAVVVASAWSGLGLLLFGLWRLLVFLRRNQKASNPPLGRSPGVVMAATLFLVPWFVLDVGWQLNLLRQHEWSWSLFAGKPHAEQHLAAEDGDYYQYARHLEKYFVFNGSSSGRLFVLQDEWQGYARLRMMYYLLPMNVYPYGSQPAPRLLREGDFLLALKPSKNQDYDKNRRRLQWKKNKKTWAVLADLLDDSRLGRLYQLRANRFLLSKLSLNHHWTRLSLNGRIMPDKVAFAGIPTMHGPAPGVIALDAVEPGKPGIRFREWEYDDDHHLTEYLSVLLARPGRYRMQDGSIWEIGRIAGEHGGQWRKVEFRRPFPETPSVFLMPQESRELPALSARISRVTNRSFTFRLERQEAGGAWSADISTAYLAIYSPKGKGEVSIDGERVGYQLFDREIGTLWNAVSSYQVRLQEEQSLDRETGHRPERVSLLMLGDALFGQVTSAREKDTVVLRMRGESERQ